MTTDLATWLLEQINRDEQSARALPHAIGNVQARWSPAKLLAECDAKRRIIEAHKTTVERERVGDAFVGKWVDIVNVTCDVCGWADSQEGSACLTVKLLSLPYAARPGYRSEWAP